MTIYCNLLFTSSRWSNTRMRADNTSVVTLMLDPPGPPRATVLRSRTSQKPQSTIPAVPTPSTTKVEEKPETPPEPENRQVPQNGLTIMTRYSDVDKPTPSEATERTPLPPCATLDGRFSVGPQEDSPKTTVTSESDDDAMTNYGNPAESYFMARLLNRSRVVNTLSDVFEEIVSVPAPQTLVPADLDACPAEPAPDAPETTDDKDDVSIQINEVSSSSPVEAPRPRGRRPKSEGRRDAPAAPNDRVLRSHHDNEPQRPHTRSKAAPPPPAAAERVVILSRRAPPRQPPPPEPGRATRSAAAPVAKLTRSLGTVAREIGARAGNSQRAPGPAPARLPPAARTGSKENLPARRRARAAAAPRAASPVTSTTPPCRALRSRNDAEPPHKRARTDDKVKPRLWPATLALRDRLRKRLAK